MPPRDVERRQNGHTPAASSARQSPAEGARPPEGGAASQRTAPRAADSVAEPPATVPASSEADGSFVVAYAETTAPEHPRVVPVTHARPPVPQAAPSREPVQLMREFEGDDTPATGVMPAVRPPRHERTTRERERYVHIPGTVDVRGDVGPLIDDLHAIFERDRAVASQGNTARCGVCYFHFSLAELVYRDAGGFYVCPDCERALGPTRIVMVRRQQRG